MFFRDVFEQISIDSSLFSNVFFQECNFIGHLNFILFGLVESGLIVGNELFSHVEVGDNFLDLLLLDNKFTSQKIELRVMRGVDHNGR